MPFVRHRIDVSVALAQVVDRLAGPFNARALPLLIVLASMPISVLEADPTTIPLDQIWTLNMPGTRDVYGIPLEGFGERDFSGLG